MKDRWGKPDEGLQRSVTEQYRAALQAYQADRHLIDEHGRQEDAFRTGGYAARQTLELVQNAADALTRAKRRGRVQILLRDDVLYCANEGDPFTEEGVIALCHAYLSDKREEEIGRFGLGFKSILAVTDNPMILSTSISFEFRAAENKEALQVLAPSARSFPVLRLPRLVDPLKEIASDPVLTELSKWAETIVKLPLARESERLANDLNRFPPEFLLFARAVERLDVNLPNGSDLHYRCVDMGDGKWRLTDLAADASSEWWVAHTPHTPSEAALAEVGETIARREITVSYAAPLDEAQTLGRFWAHFPLQDVTSARGIHNAPWRINDDRTNLLEGVFNEEILEKVAELLVDSLPHLSSSEDPAKHFDYLPARGREAPNFADKFLTELVPKLASETACVPDMNGTLKTPGQLAYPNADVRLEPETMVLWDEIPQRPSGWAHPSCYRTATRRARLRALVRRDDSRASPREVSVSDWLEAGVSTGEDLQCDHALQVFRSIKDDIARKEALKAKIVPDSQGTLHPLDSHRDVFLRGNPLSQEAGLGLVRQTFASRPGIEEALRSLGFADVDPEQELRSLSSKIGAQWTANQWEDLWHLISRVPEHAAFEILSNHLTAGMELRLLCRDKSWQPLGSVIVAGQVVPMDPATILDKQFHQPHLALLQRLGVSNRPVVSTVALQDQSLLEYLRLLRAEHVKGLPQRGRPHPATVCFRESEGLTPLHVLRRFADTSDPSSVQEWTRLLLEADVNGTWSLMDSSARLPTREVLAPHLWAVNEYGLLATPWGPRSPGQSLHPDLAERWAPLLPVALWPESRKVSTLPSPAEMPVAMWREFLARRPTGGDPWDLGQLIGDALRSIPPAETPESVPAARRDGFDLVSPTELLLASSDDECRALRERGYPFIAVASPDEASAIAKRWGCRSASSELRVDIVAEDASEPMVLLDRYRRLRDYSQGTLEGVQLVSCKSILRVVSLSSGTESEPEDFAVSERTVYYTFEIDEEDLLARISEWFGLDLDEPSIDRVRHDAQDRRVRERIASCRTADDVSAKLLALLPSTTLESRLPSGLLEAVRIDAGDGGHLQVAELLRLVYGFNVLVELRRDLEAAGFAVPNTWAGSPSAVAFVRSLGFPVEFAGERNKGKESDFIVLGPPQLPALHAYQERLSSLIQELVRTSDTPQRALLFLPTGAGKTRVTVQALAESLMKQELDSPILWIAQSDELCEQAVQTWSTVWREFGDQPLRICRLWDTNQVGNSLESHSVVVATDAKLDRVRDQDEYDWLRRASAVIIDEAHTATGDGMTATLKWLGISGGKTERPLLGLTATPFKGTGSEANRRFGRRFGDRLLNVLGDDPYEELQRLGVLAKVTHTVLPGSSFSMDPEELRRFETFRDVPQSVLERVGRDQERTLRLLEHIANQPEDWPILVFTSSVLAAQTLSALLKVREITSGTVSGSTPMSARRRTIEDFRAGHIRVLTNCNVLTQGFDAPAVRALYIAKPTFSPNAYIQMVGRGLRGPLNGGKEECLIVNMEDTFEIFGESLAYKEFDYIWNQQGGEPL